MIIKLLNKINGIGDAQDIDSIANDAQDKHNVDELVKRVYSQVDEDSLERLDTTQEFYKDSNGFVLMEFDVVDCETVNATILYSAYSLESKKDCVIILEVEGQTGAGRVDDLLRVAW